MANIPFDVQNVSICTCPSCPVQTDSQCVKQQMTGIKEALKHNPLKAEAVPGLYCASGTAFCSDINPEKACICPGCPVYVQYKLKSAQPVLYFCRDGSAK